MIYSKTNNYHDIKFSNGDYLQNCTFEDDSIFYHDRFIGSMIHCCVDSVHWEHMQTNKNVKLLHVNSGETIGYGFALALNQIIKIHKVDPNQIYVILHDELHKSYLMDRLKKLNILGINIGVFDMLFLKTVVPNINISSGKKFSVLSRNFKLWRLKLYLNLAKNNLLDDFVYSFYNINPYNNFTYDLNSILSELDNNKITVNEVELDWLHKIPYILDIEKNNKITDLSNKVWTDESYTIIGSSDIHLIVETNFEHKLSINFITEKTYKTLSCSKPFLMFSTMNFLADLRSMGYKTFSPHIDETYDTIADNEQRLLAIVNEIKRIKNLNDIDYSILLSNCNSIANDNFKIFKEKKAASVNEDNFNPAFDFLKPYIKKHEGSDFCTVIN